MSRLPGEGVYRLKRLLKTSNNNDSLDYDGNTEGIVLLTLYIKCIRYTVWISLMNKN